MARSKETQGKKENDKKKQKRKKEKLEKREERKANYVKGKSLEDMMAYVDENGNISLTPPDPTKKREIKVEDIQVGAAFREPEDPADLLRKGTVTFFNDAKGYGFIKDSKSGESIFVHANALSKPIRENNKVTFMVEKGLKGPNAVNVNIVE
jgi:cold shock CspA family protein